MEVIQLSESHMDRIPEGLWRRAPRARIPLKRVSSVRVRLVTQASDVKRPKQTTEMMMRMSRH
jgi:hypothetical protein